MFREDVIAVLKAIEQHGPVNVRTVSETLELEENRVRDIVNCLGFGGFIAKQNATSGLEKYAYIRTDKQLTVRQSFIWPSREELAVTRTWKLNRRKNGRSTISDGARDLSGRVPDVAQVADDRAVEKDLVGTNDSGVL